MSELNRPTFPAVAASLCREKSNVVYLLNENGSVIYTTKYRGPSIAAAAAAAAAVVVVVVVVVVLWMFYN